MLDLVRNPEDRFSSDAAQFIFLSLCQSLFGPGDDHQLIPGETTIETVEKNAEQVVLPNVVGKFLFYQLTVKLLKMLLLPSNWFYYRIKKVE